jgi:hypothetical protein
MDNSKFCIKHYQVYHSKKQDNERGHWRDSSGRENKQCYSVGKQQDEKGGDVNPAENSELSSVMRWQHDSTILI